MSQTLLIDYKPRDWQKTCHASRKRFSVFSLHRRAGKTELAIMELIDKALKSTLDLPLFVYVAPFLKQAKAIAWVRIKNKLKPLIDNNLVIVNESELTVKLPNGALVRIMGGDNPDAIRGVRLDGVVIDEVAQIKPEVWTDIIQPALSDRMGWAIFIGTPNGINLFSELFFRASTYPDWHSSKYTCYDTNAIDANEIERLKRDMSESSFAREYLCDFSSGGIDQLISMADINDATSRVIMPHDYDYAPIIIGVDPARYGDDRSVIVRRQGLKIFDPIILNGLNNMELASRVAKEIDDHSPDAVFIDSGAGAGVIDRLRDINHDCTEIAFSGKPDDNRYLNKRAEMWFNLRDWILSGGCMPDLLSLKQDIGAPTYFYNSSGKIQLESKQDIKKRGLPSPDIADAIALTFAMPITKRKHEHKYINHNLSAGWMG